MRQKILVYTIVFALLTYIIGSCANTSTPPMGGPKDTIPPVLLEVIPNSGATGVSLKGATIELKFNEYIQRPKDPREISFSPPLEKNVVIKMRGKSLIISSEAPLDSLTTYTLSFGNSIVDNNEGNKLPPYTFIFSTGSHIDSMLCSGYVLDASTHMPQHNIKVALYKDHSDSVIYNSLPSAIAKTDSAGYFVIRNIPAKEYLAFALSDENGNNKYDPDNEKIAFLDTLIFPAKVLRETMPELRPYDKKDTTLESRRPADFTMYLFKEDPFVQYVKENKRTEQRRVSIVFGAPQVQLLSASFEGIDSTAVLKEFNLKRDSLSLWITDAVATLPDTLKLSLTYYKSDSLRQLSPATEELKLVHRGQNDSTSLKPMSVLIKSDPVTIDTEGFTITLPAPLSTIIRDSINIESSDVRKNITKIPFEIVKDTTSYLRYRIIPGTKLDTGSEYTLNIPDSAFVSIYGTYNLAASSKIDLPTNEKLSRIVMNISAGIEGSVFIDLMDGKRQKIHRTYYISGESDNKLEFPYLAAGDYIIRVSHDRNQNGYIDTGNIREKSQPEKVAIYTLANGKDIITLTEGKEIEQSMDLKELFK